MTERTYIVTPKGRKFVTVFYVHGMFVDITESKSKRAAIAKGERHKQGGLRK